MRKSASIAMLGLLGLATLVLVSVGVYDYATPYQRVLSSAPFQIPERDRVQDRDPEPVLDSHRAAQSSDRAKMLAFILHRTYSRSCRTAQELDSAAAKLPFELCVDHLVATRGPGFLSKTAAISDTDVRQMYENLIR